MDTKQQQQLVLNSFLVLGQKQCINIYLPIQCTKAVHPTVHSFKLKLKYGFQAGLILN